jgi:GNAT superfamily N-acetyltransferase
MTKAVQWLPRYGNYSSRTASSMSSGANPAVANSGLLNGCRASFVVRIFPAVTSNDAKAVMECTNNAFMVDAFFKKPEFHQRFTLEDVELLMRKPDSIFLIAATRVSEDMELTSDTIAGSTHLEWDVNASTGELTGHFSAVAVPSIYAGKGIGQALVKSVEDELLRQADKLDEIHNTRHKVISSMGVLNVRPDLFQWYERQGYVQSLRLPDTEELARIKLDEAQDVHCILFKKVLR